jgi:hypothetical protein
VPHQRLLVSPNVAAVRPALSEASRWACARPMSPRSNAALVTGMVRNRRAKRTSARASRPGNRHLSASQVAVDW